MKTSTNFTTRVLVAMLILLAAALGILLAQNSRFRSTLARQALGETERHYQEARMLEEQELRTMRVSLDQALHQLAELDDLSEEETKLLETAITLTDDILEATTSKGINLE